MEDRNTTNTNGDQVPGCRWGNDWNEAEEEGINKINQHFTCCGVIIGMQRTKKKSIKSISTSTCNRNQDTDGEDKGLLGDQRGAEAKTQLQQGGGKTRFRTRPVRQE
jgi:hypothetical protein